MHSCFTRQTSNCKLQPQQSQLLPKLAAGPHDAHLNKQVETQREGKSVKKSQNGNYRWSQVQNRRYIQFLTNYISLFDLSLDKRRKIKIQVMLSNFIQTRTANQCRSHHQKMLNKFRSVPNIVSSFSQLLSITNIDKSFEVKREDHKQESGVKNQNQFAGSQEGIQSCEEQKSFVKEEELLNQQSYVFYKTFD